MDAESDYPACLHRPERPGVVPDTGKAEVDCLAMRARRSLFVVAAAVVVVVAGVVVDARLGRPSPRPAPEVLAVAPSSTTLPLPTSTSTTAAVVDEPVSPPTTLGTAGGARPSGRASALRLGQARPPAFPAVVADARGDSVALYSAPDEAEPGDVIDNPTWEGLPVVFLVQQQVGDWLEVQVSMRPNEGTAWVRASDVSLRQVPYRIVVDTGAKRLTAYSREGAFLDVAVAVGAGSTPTPTGNYFVDGAVKVPTDDGPYGAYQLSVAAFSNVHYSFGGGVGQIAIHGTNNPALIGTPASNGCVRMTNDDVTVLAHSVPVGTPVQII